MGQPYGLPQQSGFQGLNQKTECPGVSRARAGKKFASNSLFDQVFPQDHLSINDLSLAKGSKIIAKDFAAKEARFRCTPGISMPLPTFWLTPSSCRR
jgi:hypothetical protein